MFSQGNGSMASGSGSAIMSSLAKCHMAQMALLQWVPHVVIHARLALGRPRCEAPPGSPRALAFLGCVGRPALCCFAAFAAFAAAFAARDALPSSLRDRMSRRWPALIVRAQAALQLILLLLTAASFVFRPPPGPTSAPRAPSRAARDAFRTASVPLGAALWAEASLPLRLVFFPELTRGVVHFILCVSLAAGEPGGVGPRFAASVLLESLALPLLVPTLLGLFYAPTSAASAQLATYDNCPAAFGLRSLRDALASISASLRASLLGNLDLMDEHSARLCVV